MPPPLHLLLADARLPAGQLSTSGGVEAACATGLVRDVGSLRAFLFGRLWTSGAIAACAAAAVCARARSVRAADSLWRSAEAELDARIPSPAAREISRRSGGRMLRLAMEKTPSAVFDSLARVTRASQQQPHYPTVVGAVAAVAGLGPRDAAEAAAYAYVAGPAFAAQKLLQLEPAAIVELGVEMAPAVDRLASEAASTCLRSLSQLPSFSAPVLEYLAEEHAFRSEGSSRSEGSPV